MFGWMLLLLLLLLLVLLSFSPSSSPPLSPLFLLFLLPTKREEAAALTLSRSSPLRHRHHRHHHPGPLPDPADLFGASSSAEAGLLQERFLLREWGGGVESVEVESFFSSFRSRCHQQSFSFVPPRTSHKPRTVFAFRASSRRSFLFVIGRRAVIREDCIHFFLASPRMIWHLSRKRDFERESRRRKNKVFLFFTLVFSTSFSLRSKLVATQSRHHSRHKSFEELSLLQQFFRVNKKRERMRQKEREKKETRLLFTFTLPPLLLPPPRLS